MLNMFDDIKNLWTHKFMLISLIAIMLLPLIYSSVFVGSLWDPYGKTDELKISIVNYDKGGEINGEKTNIGNDVVDKLKDNDKFKSEEDMIKYLIDADFVDEYLDLFHKYNDDEVVVWGYRELFANNIFSIIDGKKEKEIQVFKKRKKKYKTQKPSFSIFEKIGF